MAQPQTLARLVDYFAQLGLTPGRLRARNDGEILSVVIEQSGMTDRQAHIVAEKMRSLFLVESVELRPARSRRNPGVSQA